MNVFLIKNLRQTFRNTNKTLNEYNNMFNKIEPKDLGALCNTILPSSGTYCRAVVPRLFSFTTHLKEKKFSTTHL